MGVMKILDVCCGGKMFYFDKNGQGAIFCDRRHAYFEFKGNRSVSVSPAVLSDFTMLPFKDNIFSLVIFDPPHLVRCGNESWLNKKYGRLDPGWKKDIKKGFSECWRVLRVDGTLIFKWNETDIKIAELKKLFCVDPLLGQRTTKNLMTHWMVFFKESDENKTRK